MWRRLFGSKLKVGDLAPDFSLLDQQSRPVALASYRGKSIVVLYFYPKDNTYHCIAESCSFRDSYEVFRQAGAEVIGVSSDGPVSHAEFARKYKLPFTLLSDSDNKVRKAYGVPLIVGLIPTRVTFVIDKRGVVRHVFSSQFHPKSHVDEALRVIDTLSREAV